MPSSIQRGDGGDDDDVLCASQRSPESSFCSKQQAAAWRDAMPAHHPCRRLVAVPTEMMLLLKRYKMTCLLYPSITSCVSLR